LRWRDDREAVVTYLWIFGAVCLALFAAALVLNSAGRGFGPWAGLARLTGGDHDLGTVSFPTLVRRATPNDALVCPAGHCAAKADLEATVFTVPAAALRRALVDLVRAEPRTEELAVGSDDELRARFVQRSALLRFPDVIDAEIITIDATHSTLALYSRSVIGISDLGVNRARLARWLEALRR
jgi:uncharacterized protein (DUF1499 family)